MITVQLSFFAKTDLAEIHSYIAENNPATADKIIDELIEKFRLPSAKLRARQSTARVNRRSSQLSAPALYNFLFSN